MSEWVLGLAIALLTASAGDLLRPRHWRIAEHWRDPAPWIIRWLLPLARKTSSMIPLSKPRAEKVTKALNRAGLGYTLLPSEYTALRLIFGLTAGFLGVVIIPAPLILSLVIGIGLGWSYPAIWLHDQTRRRQTIIEREFPSLLDLLALSMRAGLSLNAALGQCTQRMDSSPLQIECQRLMRELRTGTARAAALEHLAERVDLPAVHNFVAAILQAEATGGSISHILEDQAIQRRRERFMRAEKAASEAPVRMLLPLVALLFPITFLIIGFPIALQFMDSGIGSAL